MTASVSAYRALFSCVEPALATCRTRCLQRSFSHYPRRLLASNNGGASNESDTACPDTLLIFHRHGDRSPLKGHTPDEELVSASDEEQNVERPGSRAVSATAEEFWRSQLVQQESVARLNSLYPVRVSPGEAVPPDQVSAPFGCLTFLGLEQLRERGRQLREGYMTDELDNAEIEVFSTNYRRTQLSAQGFLDGLREGKGGVPVVVRSGHDDFLNNWESQGHAMKELMLMVEAKPSFKETEQQIGGKLKQLLNKSNQALFPMPAGGRFRWMMAADFFMSARARGLQVPADLDSLGTATIRHLAWRFRQFYTDADMIKTMVGPLLAYIIQCAGVTAKTSGGGDGLRLSRIVSSSCHDVTILALLYAMDSHLLEAEDYWPPYGSTIMFVVYRSKGGDLPREAGGEIGEDEDSVALAISIDGDPLRSRFLGATEGHVSLANFRRAVAHLLPEA